MLKSKCLKTCIYFGTSKHVNTWSDLLKNSVFSTLQWGISVLNGCSEIKIRPFMVWGFGLGGGLRCIGKFFILLDHINCLITEYNEKLILFGTRKVIDDSRCGILSKEPGLEIMITEQSPAFS